MSIAPEILEAMKDAGASIDVILAAIRADSALVEKAAEERRAKDRERQQRHRMSRKVTVTTRDTRDASPNEDNLTPGNITPTKPSGLEPPKLKSRKTSLPLNWQSAPIKPDGVAGRIISGWPAGRMERELSKFKDHALANGVKHDDWDAAFRNWIKKADEFDDKRSLQGTRTSSPDGLSPTTRASNFVFGQSPASVHQ